MYGTVVKMRLKPGCEAQMLDLMREYNAQDIPGYVGEYLYRSDADPQVYFMAVQFADRESYQANAQDPAQHERYLAYRALLDADPEWNDGTVVHPS